MNDKRNLISILPIILLAVAGVAILASIGAWVYFRQATVGGLLTLVLAFLCAAIAAYLRPDVARELLSTRQAQHGGNVLVMSVLLIAILLVVNMLFNSAWPRPSWLSWLPTFEKQWDLTAAQDYSLSKETIDVIKSIKEPVDMLAFYTATSDDRFLLENYARQNPLLKLQWIDPYAQPVLAEKYGVAYDQSVVFQAGERLQAADSVTEVGLSSALIKVLRVKQPVVYFSTGHGENNIDDSSEQGYSQIKTALESAGLQVRTLATAITNTIPSDAATVIIASPTQSFSAIEANILKSYLAQGGSAMIILDFTNATKQSDTLYGLGPVLDEWGVTMRNDLVIDAISSLFDSSSLERIYFAPAVAEYGYSSITSKLQGNASVFMTTRSISQTRQIEGVQFTALAQSSTDSWSITKVSEVEAAIQAHRAPQPEAQDPHGPLTMAASLENTQTRGRLVLFGGGTFANNLWLVATVGNRDLFLNAANWLSASAGEQETFQLPPKQNAVTRQLKPLGADNILAAGLVSICLLPLGMAIVGLLVWWRRR